MAMMSFVNIEVKSVVMSSKMRWCKYLCGMLRSVVDG